MSYTISVLAAAFAFVIIAQRVRIYCLENELRHAHRQLSELDAIGIAALAQRDSARATIAKQAAELAGLYEYNHDLENRVAYQEYAPSMSYVEWLESIGLGDMEALK